MKTHLVCLAALAACGGGGGNNNDGPGGDGSIDTVVPTMITISGTASSRGLGGTTPVDGAMIAAFASSDEANPVATATTDAQGNFSLTITTSGAALDGFLKATKSGMKTSYLYPPAPVSADLAMVPMNMLTTGNYDTLSTLAQGNQQPTNGLIAMLVLSGPDLTSTPVAGATISSSPASNPYRYNGGTGLPSSQSTSTQADGIGYAFNAPVGAITVSAMKTGSTFKPTALKSHADALTQTIITP